ncbi:MAG: hypothetical protein OXI91_10925 [Chloroflexota bacterium]|nr:hypothetical protein [Chloroflexota bacterium]
MQDKTRQATTERLMRLIEELTPEQQSVLLMLLETMTCACNACKCDIEEKLAKAPRGSTLAEAGIDAQDWVDHLRGHRCG